MEAGAGRKSREGQGTKKSRGLGGAPFMCRRAWDTISKKDFYRLGQQAAPARGGGRRRTAIWAGPRLGQPVQRDHPQKPPTATVPAQIPPPPPSPIGGPDVAKPTWEPALLQPWEAPGRCSTVICRASTWIPSTKRISRRVDPSGGSWAGAVRPRRWASGIGLCWSLA